MAADAHQDRGAYTITAPENGKYRFCFSNEKNADGSKTVSFNTRIHEKSSEGIESIWTNRMTVNHLLLVKIDPLQVEIEELAESIFAIKSSQEYIVARERRHRDSKWMIKEDEWH